MTTFLYEAIDPDGTRLEGTVEAGDLKAASRVLKRRGLTAIALRAAEPHRVEGRRRAVGPRERMLAIGELAMLVEAGVTLAEALPTLADRGEDGPLARAFVAMDRQMKQGRTLADALRVGLPDLPSYVFQLAEAGAETGRLGASLRDAALQMETEDRFRQEVRNALAYPVILVLAGVGAILFIFIAVVPRFSAMFAGRLDDLPTLSRWVLGVGVLVNDNLMPTLLGSIAGAVATVMALRRPRVRQRLFEGALRLPVVGPWLIEQEIARWSSMMAKLLAHRVALMRALELARGALRSRKLAQQMSRVERAVRGGAAWRAVRGCGRRGAGATSIRPGPSVTGSSSIAMGLGSGAGSRTETGNARRWSAQLAAARSRTAAQARRRAALGGRRRVGIMLAPRGLARRREEGMPPRPQR